MHRKRNERERTRHPKKQKHRKFPKQYPKGSDNGSQKEAKRVSKTGPVATKKEGFRAENQITL